MIKNQTNLVPNHIAINMDYCNKIRIQTYSTKDVEVNCEIDDENEHDTDTDRKLGLEIRGVTVSCFRGKCEVATVISWRRWW